MIVFDIIVSIIIVLYVIVSVVRYINSKDKKKVEEKQKSGNGVFNENFDEYGLLEMYFRIEGNHIVDVQSQYESTVKLVYSDAPIPLYTDSKDEVEILRESHNRKKHSLVFPEKEKTYRHLFIYGEKNTPVTVTIFQPVEEKA